MKLIILITLFFLLFTGCSKEPKIPMKTPDVTRTIDVPTLPVCETESYESTASIISKHLPKTHLIKSDFSHLPDWHQEDYDDALKNFINSCKTGKTKKIYQQICQKAKQADDAQSFIQTEFLPYEINTKNGEEEGLLTGYYEPALNGSLTQSKKYKYPIYTTPSDLITVDLSSIYPHLKNYRLRGKLVGNRVVPYNTRKEGAVENEKSSVICYVDSKIDLFFLEIQGSGRVKLDNGEVIFVGYDNQNGHRYRAIGKYLVQIGALQLKDVSLQTIRAWLEKNPSRVDEVLNYNKSVVYFKQRKNPASGALGLCLTPERSIAVDRKYIPLGSMLYLNADIDGKEVSKIVLAQDTGGAIKGAIRADMFLGYGEDAMRTAGELKSALKLWILLPKGEG